MSDKLKSLAASYDIYAKQIGGCSDGHCVLVKPQGQHTNGGCHCGERGDEKRLHHLLVIARAMVNEIRGAQTDR